MRGAGARAPGGAPPAPAPISNTRSPGHTSAAITILRTRLGSTRKCCPSALLGRTPWAASSRAVAARPSGFSAHTAPPRRVGARDPRYLLGGHTPDSGKSGADGHHGG